MSKLCQDVDVGDEDLKTGALPTSCHDNFTRKNDRNMSQTNFFFPKCNVQKLSSFA